MTKQMDEGLKELKPLVDQVLFADLKVDERLKRRVLKRVNQEDTMGRPPRWRRPLVAVLVTALLLAGLTMLPTTTQAMDRAIEYLKHWRLSRVESGIRQSEMRFAVSSSGRDWRTAVESLQLWTNPEDGDKIFAWFGERIQDGPPTKLLIWMTRGQFTGEVLREGNTVYVTVSAEATEIGADVLILDKEDFHTNNVIAENDFIDSGPILPKVYGETITFIFRDAKDREIKRLDHTVKFAEPKTGE